jgi:hypothetical protein
MACETVRQRQSSYPGPDAHCSRAHRDDAQLQLNFPRCALQASLDPGESHQHCGLLAGRYDATRPCGAVWAQSYLGYKNMEPAAQWS